MARKEAALLAYSAQACSPKAYVLQQEKPPKWEAGVAQPQSSPRSPQLEKAYAQQQRPSIAKKINE